MLCFFRKPFMLLELTVKVCLMPLTRFQKALFVTQKHAGFSFLIGQVACTIVVRKACQRIVTRRANLLKLLRIRSRTALDVVGDNPHRDAAALPPSGHEFAPGPPAPQRGQCAANLSPGTGFGLYILLVFFPIINDGPLVSEV